MSEKPYRHVVTVYPLQDIHTHTIISLHGRGGNGKALRDHLLEFSGLEERLPTVKFIFPSARRRETAALDGKPFRQWFDMWSLDPNEKTDLQVEGLRDSAEYIRRLIDEEAKKLGEDGYSKIILWGSSQGCASGIFTLLGDWPNLSGAKKVGAFVGLSGWLPFEEKIHETFRDVLDSTAAQSDQAARSPHIKDSDSDEKAETKDPEASGAPETESLDSNDSSSAGSAHRDDEVARPPRNQGSRSDDERAGIKKDTEIGGASDAESFCSSDSPSIGSFQWDNVDPFIKTKAASKENEDPSPMPALNIIRAVLNLDKIPTDDPEKQRPSDFPHLGTPVFLGHGLKDSVIPASIGEKMKDVLSVGLGMDVTWKVYEGLGHIYRTRDEIQDVLSFLHDKVGLPDVGFQGCKTFETGDKAPETGELSDGGNKGVVPR